jgi:hypothetical protein
MTEPQELQELQEPTRDDDPWSKDVLEAIRKEADQAMDALIDLRMRIFDQLFPNNDGSLYNHAVRELKLAGLDHEDSDYDGDLYVWILQLVRVFVSQGHSGGSASRTTDLFCRLVRYETLSPNDHSMYQDVSGRIEKPDGSLLQDLRNSRFFSEDAGKTWFMVDDAGTKIPEIEPIEPIEP